MDTPIPRYVDMCLDGRLNLGDMISDRLELSEINEGFARMQTGQVVREIVVFDPME